MTITGCMVPEVWSVTDRIFCHFGPFFAFTLLTTQKIKILKNCEICWRYYHFTHMYHKWQSSDVWFLRYQVQQPDFLSFWIIFLPFYNPKNQNFEKMKNTPGDIIILHKYTKNHDHMLHCSWDMAHDGCNCYFSFWAIFLTFYVYQKLWLDDAPFLRYGAWQTDRQADRRMEKGTHRGGYPT